MRQVQVLAKQAVVEDEKKLAGFIKRALKEDGHAVVEIADDGAFRATVLA